MKKYMVLGAAFCVAFAFTGCKSQESAYKKVLGDTTTYNVAVYAVDENALDGYGQDLRDIQVRSKSKAKAVADDGVMTRAAHAAIVLNKDTGAVVSFARK